MPQSQQSCENLGAVLWRGVCGLRPCEDCVVGRVRSIFVFLCSLLDHTDLMLMVDWRASRHTLQSKPAPNCTLACPAVRNVCGPPSRLRRRTTSAYLVSQLSECLYLSAESIPRGFSRAHVAGKPRAGGGAPKIASPRPISGRWSAACERRLWGVSPLSGPKPSGWHPKPTSGEK